LRISKSQLFFQNGKDGKSSLSIHITKREGDKQQRQHLPASISPSQELCGGGHLIETMLCARRRFKGILPVEFAPVVLHSKFRESSCCSCVLPPENSRLWCPNQVLRGVSGRRAQRVSIVEFSAKVSFDESVLGRLNGNTHHKVWLTRQREKCIGWCSEDPCHESFCLQIFASREKRSFDPPL
jgi:hypothetical protein